MKKQAVALIGILQLVLGLVLAYQAGFASGGVFAPQSLKPNDIFYGQSYYMYADFNPTSATIPTGSSQTLHNCFVRLTKRDSPSRQTTPHFHGQLMEFKLLLAVLAWKPYSVSGLGVGTHSVECDASNYDSNNGWDYVTCTASLTVTGQSTPAPTSQATYSAYAGDGTEVGTASVTVQDLTRGTSATGVGYSGSLSVGLGDSLRFSCTVPNGYGFVYWSGTSYSAVNPMIVVVSGSNVFEDCYYGVVTNPTPTPTATPTWSDAFTNASCKSDSQPNLQCSHDRLSTGWNWWVQLDSAGNLFRAT